MKPREIHWTWEKETDKIEPIPPEEIVHMFWLFRATKLDGHRLFFIQKVGPHSYRVTHMLGMTAIISWTVLVPVPAAPVLLEESFA